MNTSTDTPSTKLTAASVFDRILDATDSELDIFIQAVRTRRKLLAEKRAIEMRASLQPGDNAVLTNLSSKYLNGLAVVVEKCGSKTARVRLTPNAVASLTPKRRIRFSEGFEVQLQCIDKVD